MRRPPIVRVVALAAALSLLACGGVEAFRADAFHPPSRLLVIDYADPVARTLTSSEWAIDNYVPVGSGWPSATKTGGDYRTQLAIDGDGDGLVDWNQETDLYDLRAEHAATGAAVWVRSVGLTYALRRRDLAVLAHDYVERVTGGTFVAIDLGEGTLIRERRLSVRVLEEGPATITGRAAHRIRFEVVDVDRAALDPSAPTTRVEVILVRTPGRFHVGAVLSSHPRRVPGLAILGFSAPSDRFDGLRPEAVELWSRVRLLGAHGSTEIGGTSGGEAPSPEMLGQP